MSHTHMLRIQSDLSPLRAFEDVQVWWRATFSTHALSLTNDGIDLARELAQTSGIALCRAGETLCPLPLEVQDDEVRGEARNRTHSERGIDFFVFI